MIAVLSLAEAQESVFPKRFFLKQPKALGLDLFDVEHGGSKWIAVGEEGVVVESMDGVDWSVNFIPNAPRLTDVLYVDGTWTVVGTEGRDYRHDRLVVLQSTDSKEWRRLSIPFPNNGSSREEFFIQHEKGRWVITGGVGLIQNGNENYGTLILTSENGQDWQDQFILTEFSPHSLGYGNGIWAVMTRSTLNVSTDGIRWTERRYPFERRARRLAFTGSLWTAIVDGTHGFYISHDLEEWELVDASVELNPVTPSRVSHTNGDWLVVGDCCGIIDTSEDGVNWQRNLTLRGAGINAIRFANDTYVAVGQNGYIGTSSDLTYWNEISAQDNYGEVTDIEYGGGQWRIAAGQNGILVSEDSVRWRREAHFAIDLEYGQNQWMAATGTKLFRIDASGDWEQALGTSGRINSVAFANGRWIATGSRFMTSTDGHQWAPIPLSYSVQWSGNDIEFADGLWVFGGHVNDMPGIQTFREPGEWNWKSAPSSRAYPLEVEYGNGVWLAFGESPLLRKSSNGINWFPHLIGLTENAWFRTLAFGQSQWLAVESNGTLWHSVDGLDWAERKKSFGNADQIRFENGLWLASGRDFGGLWIRTSPDGVQWTPVHGNSTIDSSFPKGSIMDLQHHDDKWVAITSYDGMFESPDLESWSKILPNADSQGRFEALEYGSDRWVAVGQDTLVVSGENGEWEQIPLEPETHLRSIAHLEGTWIAEGRNSKGRQLMLKSEDLIQWTPLDSADVPDFQELFAERGLWLGVKHNWGWDLGSAESAEIFSSSDGITWVPQAAIPSAAIVRLKYLNDQWVAVGSKDRRFGIWTSPDLASWHEAKILRGSPFDSIGLHCFAVGSDFITDVEYANGLWVATGRIWECSDGGGPPAYGDVLVSEDGKIWRSLGITDLLRFRSVEFHNGRWIFAGDEGAIMTTEYLDPFLSISKNTTSQELNFSWPAFAADYQLEATSDLVTPFKPLNGGNRTSNDDNILETYSLSAPQRFFRLKRQ